jgi:hypothetical protein
VKGTRLNTGPLYFYPEDEGRKFFLNIRSVLQNRVVILHNGFINANITKK